MAQSADVLTLEEAHWRVMSKITEVETFLQQHTTVGGLHQSQRARAGELHRTLARQSSILRILWHAEPNEARYHNMREWINVIEDEVETKLRAMEVFALVREKQYLDDSQAGAQATSSHVGWIVLPQRQGAKT